MERNSGHLRSRCRNTSVYQLIKTNKTQVLWLVVVAEKPYKTISSAS